MHQYFENNNDLESKLRIIDYDYDTFHMSFFSDLGVFSKDHIDFGSRLLLETYLKHKKDIKSVLDVGCGYGFIGISIAKVTGSYVELIDVNNRAIHLTEKNIKKNGINGKVYLSNVYENVSDKYDLIITNPPIRAGKKVYYDILMNAKEHMMPNGELWFVIRKEQGAKSTLKDMAKYYELEVVEKSKGFYIILAKNN